MNFTREPIIETVITPRDGCKLVIRSSKGNGQEDYFVDAVEVVSFGHSFFFRSLERPKSFLVPVSDYEILELKETKMVLKNASLDRSIKIGGGKEQQMRPQKEMQKEMQKEPQEEQDSSSQPERKRDKRRRGRRGRDRQDVSSQETKAPEKEATLVKEEMETAEPSLEPEKTPSFISKLFPPPPTLIRESLGRYKPVETEDPLFPPALQNEEEAVSESMFEHQDTPEEPFSEPKREEKEETEPEEE